MGPKIQPSKKQNRKGDNPIRVPPIIETTEPGSGSRFLSTWICTNSACRAKLSTVVTFCKWCSCCICHSFDENKDPSLWLECTSESGESCGSSCHIECAIQHGMVGVVDRGLLTRLDGSYWCASCGQISGILGCWKKQLTIAKSCRRVDSLCYRIHVSYRLLDGTSRFQDLHNFVKDAKNKLESEVGPLSEVSAKMARGIVSRLSVAADVQLLCDAAIQMADKLSTSLSAAKLDDGSTSATCKFIIKEITASSVVLVVTEISTTFVNDILGFKLWYKKTEEPTRTKYPISIFPISENRILIPNLQPCTEYSFRITPFTKTGDLGQSEAKCLTSKLEIPHPKPDDVTVPQNDLGTKYVEPNSGFKVRNLGKSLQLLLTDFHGQKVNPETSKVNKSPFMSCGLNLNIANVPDLNKDVNPLIDLSRDETDLVSDVTENWARARAQHGPNGVLPAVDSRADVSRKRPASTNIPDSDCGSRSIRGSGNLDENFQYCVKTIRSLECQGYMTQAFRVKLLSWFGLRSTEQKRRVVNTYIRTLVDDPRSLAGQLVDTFAAIVNR